MTVPPMNSGLTIICAADHSCPKLSSCREQAYERNKVSARVLHGVRSHRQSAELTRFPTRRLVSRERQPRARSSRASESIPRSSTPDLD